MDLGLTDRVAVVTGSSKGLGFASARALVAEGCRVVICARTPDALQEARRRLAEIGGDDRVVAVVSDVSREDGAQKVVDQAVTAFGGLDILVNNVGTARGGGLLETTDELWEDAFDQTLMPSVRVSRLAVPHMQRRGGGSIVIMPGPPKEMEAVFTLHVSESVANLSAHKTAALRVVVTMYESEVSPLMQAVMARFPSCYLKAYVALRDAGGQTLPVDVVATGADDHAARQILQEAVTCFGELVTARGKVMEYYQDE